MSRPTDENDNRPEEAIEPESISPAEDLGSSEAAAGTALEQSSLKSLDPEDQKDFARAKIREVESQAEYNEEAAEEKRLANEERKRQKPRVKRAVSISFWLGLFLIVLGIVVILFNGYQAVKQGEAIEPGFNSIVLIVVGVVLLFGSRFISSLLNLTR